VAGSRRGRLRGGSIGASRVRVRPAPHYGAPGSSLRVAAAGTAVRAAAVLDDEDWVPEGKRTGPGNYTHRAWPLGAGPTRGPTSVSYWAAPSAPWGCNDPRPGWHQ
uniref:Shadow of prion protein n=1 Tax=Rhinopithecus roxellana TaxID=61622 RepID=A0A2K6PI48_RHIRO